MKCSSSIRHEEKEKNTIKKEESERVVKSVSEESVCGCEVGVRYRGWEFASCSCCSLSENFWGRSHHIEIMAQSVIAEAAALSKTLSAHVSKQRTTHVYGQNINHVVSIWSRLDSIVVGFLRCVDRWLVLDIQTIQELVSVRELSVCIICWNQRIWNSGRVRDYLFGDLWQSHSMIKSLHCGRAVKDKTMYVLPQIHHPEWVHIWF